MICLVGGGYAAGRKGITFDDIRQALSQARRAANKTTLVGVTR